MSASMRQAPALRHMTIVKGALTIVKGAGAGSSVSRFPKVFCGPAPPNWLRKNVGLGRHPLTAVPPLREP